VLNEQEYVIVADFDGTITQIDTNYLLVKAFGSEENDQLELDLIAGKLGSREAFLRHFELMRITSQEYRDFICSAIEIDNGFDFFLEQVKRCAIPFYIVSAGYRQAIEYVLGGSRLQGVEVYANDLLGEPYLKPLFAGEKKVCDKTFGPCGNCKLDYLKKIRKKVGRKILFIGDGLTDRCAVEEADMLFAKDSLAKFCDEDGVFYVPYKGFTDIAKYLWPMLL